MKDFFNSIMKMINDQSENFTLKFPTGYELTVTNILSGNPKDYEMYINIRPNSNERRLVGTICNINLFKRCLYGTKN